MNLIKVTLESEVEVEPGTVERRISILAEDAGEDASSPDIRVQHVQFNDWPNYGVVENLKQLTTFIKKVLRHHFKYSSIQGGNLIKYKVYHKKKPVFQN